MSELIKIKVVDLQAIKFRFLVSGVLKARNGQKSTQTPKKPLDFQQTIAIILLEIDKNRIFAALFKKQRWKNVMRRSSF